MARRITQAATVAPSAPSREPLHERIWYGKHPLGPILAPLGWVYGAVMWLRRRGYHEGVFHSAGVPVPVIVVGNLSVGGTGKTPFVVWLVAHLRHLGHRPGIVSRGYGGSATRWPQQVRPDSSPATVGDEPVLLARRCRCPIAVGPDRVAAAAALLEHHDCDIVVADDGLQHYALERDIEIAIVDGVRRYGNGRCLPAGPLRETRHRIEDVDIIVCNGVPSRGEFRMTLVARTARRLGTDGEERPIGSFAGVRVHAVAGIGNPARFFDDLRRHGVDVIEHPFPDHHRFTADDLGFGDDLPVMMTEKDAVKCESFDLPRAWYVPVTAEVAPQLEIRLQHALGGIATDGQETA